MGSACSVQGGANVTPNNNNNDNDSIAVALELTPTTIQDEQKQNNDNDQKNKKNKDDDDLHDDLPPPPPKNCPEWQKLNHMKRHKFVKKNPLLAIQSLDEYWLRKIDKYVTKGKLPLLGKGTKGDAAWKLMIETQGKTQDQRMMIWNEFLTTSFSDLVSKEEVVVNQASSDMKESGGEDEGEGARKVEETGRQTGTRKLDAAGPQGLKGIAAMRATAKSSGVGVTSRQSSGVREGTKISVEKRQVEALGMLSETIKRMRRINTLLRQRFVLFSLHSQYFVST